MHKPIYSTSLDKEEEEEEENRKVKSLFFYNMSGETRTPQLKPTSFEDELDVTFKPLDNAPKTGPGRNDEELNLKWIKTDIEDALDPNGGPTKRPKIKWAGGAGPSEDNHGGELKEPVVDQADRS